jgi:hypothetical protein
LDQCSASEIGSNKIMGRFIKSQLMATAAPQTPASVRGTAALSVRPGQATVKAAWPTGVSVLAQAVDACQRRDSLDADWLARAPDSIVLPRPYCAID